MGGVIISDNELSAYGNTQDLALKAESLLKHQKDNWELVKKNFDALDDVKIKEYEFDDFHFTTQYNPSRIISSSAKVDKASIADRACFLCKENLPRVQKGINYKNKYLILCNPYPIFKQHLTIPHHEHIPQSIHDSFNDLLELSYDLRSKFFVFYNGPKCGASAPDHMHFQAGLKNSVPLEKFYRNFFDDKNSLINNDHTKTCIVIKKIFNYIFIQSKKTHQIHSIFKKILNQLKSYSNTPEEPLLNIISLYEEDRWNVFIFPRKKHRPRQYFLDGEEKLLISPASVDLAGLLITPREEDFDKLTNADIENIYRQVVYNEEKLMQIKNVF